ncbi:DUF4238 domain-containing protein [Motiliproteus sp. MSK22-1]|uniref:DUF4238 domain-containing protein n=1 Tax=Motiliproteus sp. MSK22-1 TaxID=1897630 RepID=UPI000975FD97|nr:DUF4238 domain-containing protein [Motiliproteus sp. MSK22-1]OMH30217.1 hypothetical protein BGP75_17635 [Motiliproteus sp. MSK22-1]
MDKSRQIKRNHHYVWSFYLKSWAENNDIYYISKKGKISRDSVKGLAKETDFYKINLLNKSDVEFIKGWSSFSPDFLQDIHMSHLRDFQNLTKISSLISRSGFSSEELENTKKAIRHNSLENLHTIYEDLAVNVVSNLAKGKLSVLDDNQNMIAFCSYLGHQISRTKSFKEKCLGGMQLRANGNLQATKYAELAEKNWWFISFMLGLNIGTSLYAEKQKNNHVFVKNNTSVPFITSDTPIINIHSSLDGLGELEAPAFSDFYIPLSPSYAYMINDSSDFNHLSEIADVDMVNELNRVMYQKSFKTIFASTEEVLKNVKANNKRQQSDLRSMSPSA